MNTPDASFSNTEAFLEELEQLVETEGPVAVHPDIFDKTNIDDLFDRFSLTTEEQFLVLSERPNPDEGDLHATFVLNDTSE